MTLLSFLGRLARSAPSENRPSMPASTQPGINTLAAWRPWRRPVALLVILAQLAIAAQPLTVLAQPPEHAAAHPMAQGQLRRLAEWNQRMAQGRARQAQAPRTPADHARVRQERLAAIVRELRAPSSPADSTATQRRLQQRQALREALRQAARDPQALRDELHSHGQELRRRGAAPDILQRHEQALSRFEADAARYAQAAQTLLASPADAQADDAREQAALAPLQTLLTRQSVRGTAHSPAGPLPWRAPRPTPRVPAETPTAWHQNLYGDQRVRLAQAGPLTIGPLQFSHAPPAGRAPTEADLAETDEIRLTPALRAQAAALGHNPVAIHNWVRNHIDVHPTAGAIQSAQDTLDKRRGNPTDIAGLLIALLRASGIPARYQWGTIELDAASAQGWLGTQRPEAALQLLRQGGIPARGIAQGGRFSAIRLEHVWVQAYVNWAFGRGQFNATPTQHPHPNAGRNHWIPLDASLKTYDETAGLDLAAQAPLDAGALVQAMRRGATVHEAQGWIQHPDTAAALGQLDDWQRRLHAAIAAGPRGEAATVGDVLGTRRIRQEHPAVLAGTLPYVTVQPGAATAAVPSARQHRFTYRLHDGERILLTYTEKTSQLAARRL
ncbi:transglutaminase, partial [Ramlibacter sp. AW1]